MNEQIVSEKLNAEIQSVQTLIDVQHKIAASFAWLWGTPLYSLRRGHRALMPLLFSALHKNFFSFFAALKLTTQGFHGPAGPIIRIIFEFLITAKFCHICDNFLVLDRWASRETVYFANMILKKIISPDHQPFSDFWTMICGLSHATSSSIQLASDVNSNENLTNIKENIAMLNTLLECNYHLLNSHLITPEMEYFAEFYLTQTEGAEEKYEVHELRKEAHRIFKLNRQFLGPASISLISAYKKKWLLQSQNPSISQ